ncbi:unnamed protein product [Xylocopa violacea]|uniref:Uncharacterized protein n=1 Tax=Xylocopa violacea TaxID=135666 RepID=A0ABP1NND8_XYLVO
MLKFIILAVVAVAATTAAPAAPSKEEKPASLEDSTTVPNPVPGVLPAQVPGLVSPAALNLEPLQTTESRPARSPSFAKALSTITEIKTPASTTKLAHLVAPLATPLAAAAPILTPLQSVPAYAYALPSLPPIELAAAPSTYSIEQHGYRIIY